MHPCRRCKQLKPFDAFSPSAWKHKTSTCRACACAASKKRYWTNVDSARDIQRRYQRMRRSDPGLLMKDRVAAKNSIRKTKAAALAIAGDACHCCREWRPAFLTLGHRGNEGRTCKGARSRSGYKYKLWASIRDGNPQGIRRECWNCNSGKELNGGICPHEEERLAAALLCA
jgi:hypothetical protein